MTTRVHTIAASGFAAAATSYEQGRPAYPAAAITHLAASLGIAPESRVVDLGSGTGKLTRLLRPMGARLLALEPVESLRRTFAQVLPDIWLAGGVAEALPLHDGSVDAVVAGTCFHWFDGPIALREIHRVLRPGGRLGLLWNARDLSVDWVKQMVALVATYMHGDPPRYEGSSAWRAPFENSTLFTQLQLRQFPFVQSGDRQMVLARVASTSFVAALPEPEKQRVLGEVEALLDRHPTTQNTPTIDFPYVADVYWCSRQD
jgi:SAM-dependent methyltransferase